MRKLLILPLLLCGCTATAIYLVGTLALEHGATKISGNTAYTDFLATPLEVWDALRAEIEARNVKYEVKVAGKQLTANGHTAEALQHPKQPDYTRLQVRVGMFDQDEKYLKISQFLNAVGKRLGADAVSPAFPGAK